MPARIWHPDWRRCLRKVSPAGPDHSCSVSGIPPSSPTARHRVYQGNGRGLPVHRRYRPFSAKQRIRSRGGLWPKPVRVLPLTLRPPVARRPPLRPAHAVDGDHAAFDERALTAAIAREAAAHVGATGKIAGADNVAVFACGQALGYCGWCGQQRKNCKYRNAHRQPPKVALIAPLLRKAAA